MLWPLIPYQLRHRCVNYFGQPAPGAALARDNWLGTDDQARDVLARLIYGFRISRAVRLRC